VAAAVSASSWAADPKQGEVTKLDGKKVFGMIEVTDDYTVRVSSDSGVQNIPLAFLSEKDFRKLGFSKDRNQDGRFWSERKEALEGAQEKSEENKTDSDKEKPGSFEISLKEIAVFQPLIEVYEKSLADKKPATPENKEATDNKASLTAEGNAPMKGLFTQPSMGNSPFTGGIAPAVIEPISTAGSLVAPALPTVPTP
jgi:hypothetical protein